MPFVHVPHNKFVKLIQTSPLIPHGVVLGTQLGIFDHLPKIGFEETRRTLSPDL